MESLKIFLILLLVALPLVSATGDDPDSRKRKTDAGESSSQRASKTIRQQPAMQAPSPYPGSEFLQTPQLEYDMPQGFDTDFSELRRFGQPDFEGGSSSQPTMPMAYTPLDQAGPSSAAADPSGAGPSGAGPSGQTPAQPQFQSTNMSTEELFHNWLMSYLIVFAPENPNTMEPELFKSYLAQLKSIEQSAQFHDLYKQAELGARPQQHEKAVLWDYVKEVKLLMQQRLTLARKFKTLTDVLMQLFNWEQNSCIPNDVAKIAQIQEKLAHHPTVYRMLDYVKVNQQKDCDSRYKEVILNGEILLGQDTKEAARRMLELTAADTIKQMMTNKDDPKLLKEIVDILSLYLAQLDTAKFENFGVIEIDNPKIEYPKMYENEIINPCGRICELNQIPYEYYVKYREIVDAQGSSEKRPVSDDLEVMIKKIEFCCFVHNKKPAADEVEKHYIKKKEQILAEQDKQEAGGSGQQPPSQAGASGHGATPARLQVTLPSELLGSEAARISGKSTTRGPEREYTRSLSGVVIREPGEAHQQRAAPPAVTGAGKGVASHVDPGQAHYEQQLLQQFGTMDPHQVDQVDPLLQAQMLAHYQQQMHHHQQQQQQLHHIDPRLQAEFLAPYGQNIDPQQLEQIDPNLQAALLAQYQHEQQQLLAQHQGFLPQFHPDLAQQQMQQMQQMQMQQLQQTQQQAYHPELHQQLDPHGQYDHQLLAQLQSQYEHQLLGQYQDQLQSLPHPPAQPQPSQVHRPPHQPDKEPATESLDVSDSD